MIDLNKFFNLIKEAKKSGYYSDHEINFFYDIWEATYHKNLKDKYKSNEDDK
jgi:hypothetical protein|tara:strand:+ start:383 stop:538 length:156 start_codon:yes stop_codon:yes gene_type:complete